MTPEFQAGAESSGPSSSRSFESLLREFRRKWESGERPHAESYLPLVDSSRPYEASELIYQEFCLARKAGLAVDSSEFLRRFPEHGRSLSRLFALHETLATSELGVWGEESPLPEAGDEIGPYRLIRLLGQGGFARVFLAQQGDLDDRLLVVKVSTRITSEPRLLARLRHSHVVEVIRQATTADGELQLICMPFLGGATLADVMKVIKDRGRRPRSGADFLACLDRASAKEFPEAQAHSPARKLIASLSYPKAIAWIVARLAEALDHSDRRGVLHGDVKPSNILIPANGMPMLFDFNLSIDWHAQEALEGPPAQVGGTLAYLAPERLKSLLTPTSDDARSGRQPHRADLYSLGLVLLEALSGGSVFKPADLTFGPRALIADLAAERRRGAGAFSRLMRQTPLSLRPILEHLLTADPADRYGRGDELATDLECWIADRPTVYTDAPSWPVRVSKLARRRRGLITAAALVAVAMGVTSYVVSSRNRANATRLATEKLDDSLDRRTSSPFLFQKLGDWSPDQADPSTILDAYDFDEIDDWKSHELVRGLTQADREDLETLMLDQSYRMAKLLMNRPNSTGDWKKALRFVDRSLTQGDIKAFRRLRQELEEKLGLEAPGPIFPPSMSAPPEHLQEFMNGVEASELHARKALNSFARSLKHKPDSFWAHYRYASVACRLDMYDTAEVDLKFCIQRRSKNVALKTQLAAVLFRNGRLAEAITQCSTALKLDPEFKETSYTLMMLKRVAAQKEEDTRDRLRMLEKWSKGSSEDKFLEITRALQYVGVADIMPEIDEKTLVEFLRERPSNQTARVILATYLARSGRQKEAIIEYDEVLRWNREHLWARYGRALALKSIGREEAERELEKLIDHPRFEELFRLDPNAFQVHRFVVKYLLEMGDNLGALQAAARWREMAQQRRNRESEAIYSFARAWVPFAKVDPDYARTCGEYLRMAIDRKAAMRLWYESDVIFDDIRPILRPIIDGAGPDALPPTQLPTRNKSAEGIRLATP